MSGERSHDHASALRRKLAAADEVAEPAAAPVLAHELRQLVEEACLNAGDPERLVTLLRALPAWRQMSARIALVRAVGATRAREIFGLAFGPLGEPTAPPDTRAGYDELQTRQLTLHLHRLAGRGAAADEQLLTEAIGPAPVGPGRVHPFDFHFVSRRAADGAPDEPVDPSVVLSDLDQSEGRPLPPSLEARFGRILEHGFGHVRIHTDAVAARAATALGARAFTVGHHVYFAAGAHAPTSDEGDRLLLHELTHVIQFDRGRLPAPPRGELVVSRRADPTEREAEQAETAASAPPVQRLSATGSDDAETEEEREYIRRAAAQAVRGGGGPLPFLDVIQRSFGHHALDAVRAHTDETARRATRAMGAEAFAQGQDVAFAGAPSLHTAAHEAAHVMQQRGGVHIGGGVGAEGDQHERHADEVADRVVRGESAEHLLDRYSAPRGAATSPAVQLRRIPPNVRALLTAGVGDGANFAANADGVQRLIDRAMDDLTPAERATVLARRNGAQTDAEFALEPRRVRLSRWAEAIVAEFPAPAGFVPNAARPSGLEHLSPSGLDSPPRPLPNTDIANLQSHINRADGFFNDVATGAHDTNIDQVFGFAQRAAVKTNYRLARDAMNRLHATPSGIVTDRSRYNPEAHLGGLSSDAMIRVATGVFDQTSAANPGGTITLIHESMHAGNGNVSDNGYIDSPPGPALGTETAFTSRAATGPTAKTLNAAHYEVPARRALGVPPAYAGRVFNPAGVGAAPARTVNELGAFDAYDRFREAWTLALNLHTLYLRLFRTPTDWNTPSLVAGVTWAQCLPFWSKVEKMTLHTKAVITPASADPARHPVTAIDMALSEGVVRRLAFGMDVLSPLQSDADVLLFESTNSTAVQRTTAYPGGVRTQAAVRDFFTLLTLRQPHIGPITGVEARDVRAVRKLAETAFADIFVARNPNTFAD